MEELNKAMAAYSSDGPAVVEIDNSEVDVDFIDMNMLHKDSHRTMEV